MTTLDMTKLMRKYKGNGVNPFFICRLQNLGIDDNVVSECHSRRKRVENAIGLYTV
jgi:hypothetical protein